MSLLGMIKGKGPTGFGFSSTADEVVSGQDLSGKTILITGVTAGLGKESARVLAGAGAHIIGLARSSERAAEALADVNAAGTPIACDLSEPESVREAVKDVAALGRDIDVLLLNAGVMAIPRLQLKHGYEEQFFTNHIGHFILATGLLDSLASDGRVVVLSSAAHGQAPKGGIQFDNLDGSKGYSRWKNYGQAKLANLLFAKKLARDFEGSDRIAIAVHPGVINTNLGRHLPGFVQVAMGAGTLVGMKTIPEGAATQVFAAVHPDARAMNGEYLSHCNVEKSSYYSKDADLADRLWAESEKIVGSV